MNLLAESIQKQFTAEYTIQDIVTIVKELFENSIDAGANSISIKLINFGHKGISVTDNGPGISETDLNNICQQGATSKLRNISDLNQINTLGFRGMALYSVSQISSLTIESKHIQDNSSYKVLIRKGKVVEKNNGRIQNGTCITVSDVFYCNPVRLTDLTCRQDVYLRKIVEVVQSYSIVHYDKRISLVHEDSSGKQTALVPCVVCPSLFNKLELVIGKDMTKHFKSFSLEKGDFSVDMWMANPGVVLQKKVHLFYLNLRLVEIPAVVKRMVNVYFSSFKKGWSYVLCFKVRKGFDINVSVNKMTVYFEEEKGVVEFFGEFFKSINEVWLEGVSMVGFSDPNSVVKQKVGANTFKGIKTSEPSILPVNFQKRAIVKTDLSNFNFSSAKKPPIVSGNFVEDKLDACHTPLPQSCDCSTNLLKFRNDPFLAHPMECDEKITSLNESKFDHCHKLPQKSFESSMDPRKVNPFIRSDSEPISLITAPISDEVYMPQPLNHPEPPSQTQAILSWSINQINPKPSKTPQNSTQAPSVKNLKKDVSLEFHKTDFSKLKLIGQFNKGFIMSHKDSQLFIIDQHAADEKFLFETLQSSTTVHKQPLIVPIPIESQPCDELLIQTFQSAFESNGFALKCIESNPPGSRFALLSVPVSKNVVFGKEDFQEMLENLKKVHNAVPECELPQAIRCRKFRDMFASRACRSAVMIGTGLDNRKMSEILNNLQGLNHPWNCPHGRPTIKLLGDVYDSGFSFGKVKFNT